MKEKTVKSYRTSRDLLKVELVSTRGSYSPGKGTHPICPICSLPITNAPDMHEAIITKGQTRGHKEQYRINSIYNCVLRHHVCPDGLGSHTGGVGGDDTFEKCVKHLVHWETEENVRAWLLDMIEVFPRVGLEAFYRFNKYFPLESYEYKFKGMKVEAGNFKGVKLIMTDDKVNNE